MKLDELTLGEVNLEKRFLARVKKTRGCWHWVGSKQSQGYGRIEINGRPVVAHRLSYMLHVGSIDDGKVIHHECRNKACVNPKHLKPVSMKENAIYAANDGY